MKKIIYIVVILTTLLAGCDKDPYSGVKADIGPSLSNTSRPTTWDLTRTKISNTGFEAWAGPSCYDNDNDQEWDFYSIEILRKRGVLWHLLNEGEWTTTWYVFYQRDIKKDKVPSEIAHKHVSKIIEYNNNTHVVKFIIGTNHYSYTLPIN